jgi:adenine-specific DNA-methyltransferase
MKQTAQLSFDATVSLPKGVYDYGQRTSGETHGVVLTKPHVVELILDLAGYTIDRNLPSLSLLEPGCGDGAFLVPAVERLIHSAKRLGSADVATLGPAIAAYDIDEARVSKSRDAVAKTLQRNGITCRQAASLAERWVVHGDFLLVSQGRTFDAVVGNPPYVRIEQLAPELQAEYRRRYESLYDRADLYVAFIEKALQLLSPEGVLSFICADRWTSNKYGAPLRRLLTENYALDCYIDLHTASPFESDVIAYPSIIAVRRGAMRRVHVFTLPKASSDECAAVLPTIREGKAADPRVEVSVYDTWFHGDEPWVISSPKHLAALRALEERCRPIEVNGSARVGIGVATGCDKVYIVGEDADIESDRLVPLVMREDIVNGSIRDARRFVINTFTDNGGVIDLRDFPRLAKYLDLHVERIKRRHVAQKNPSGWFRTIDRVYPSLVSVPKLLVPDIAGANEVVYEEGRFHPHHNLYFITSDTWDMEVLGGLLSSRVALFFVWSYAVKMRGGYLRFQAQYLRRVRLPSPARISTSLAKSIRTAFRRRDFASLDALALKAYEIERLPDFAFVDTRK